MNVYQVELVSMNVGGYAAKVPADKVSLVLKKEKLVARAMEIGMASAKVVTPEMIELSRKIRNLSRRIGPCIQFC